MVSLVIKWKEVISVSLIFIFVKYCLLNGYGFETRLDNRLLYVLILCVVCFLISSNYITRHYQKNTKGSKCFKLFLVYSSISLLLGFYISYTIERPSWYAVFLGLAIGIYLYAKHAQKKSLLNNMVVSFIKPACFVLIWWIDAPISMDIKQWGLFLKIETIILYFIVSSFVANFAKTIILDLKNYKLDNIKNHQTLPVVFGEEKTKKIIIALGILILITTAFICLYFLSFMKSISLIFFIFLAVPQFYYFVVFFKVKSKDDYDTIIKGIETTLLLGLFSIPFISFAIKHLIP